MSTLQEAISELQQLQGYLQQVEEQVQEVTAALESMDEIQGTEGSEAYVPLTSGIYVKARIEDASRFLINVGQGVTTSKSLDETKQLLEDQQSELQETQEKLVQQFSEAYQRYVNLQMQGQEES